MPRPESSTWTFGGPRRGEELSRRGAGRRLRPPGCRDARRRSGPAGGSMTVRAVARRCGDRPPARRGSGGDRQRRPPRERPGFSRSASLVTRMPRKPSRGTSARVLVPSRDAVIDERDACESVAVRAKQRAQDRSCRTARGAGRARRTRRRSRVMTPSSASTGRYFSRPQWAYAVDRHRGRARTGLDRETAVSPSKPLYHYRAIL